MSHGAPSDDERNALHRREIARQKARRLREVQKKRDKRMRLVLKSGITVAIVAAVAIVAVVIIGSIRPTVKGPANMASDGIVIGKGFTAHRTDALPPDAEPRASHVVPTGSAVNIRIYTDYLCPYCAQFEATNGKELSKLVDAGAITLEIHPISLLSSLSAGTKYSLRAANAAACVADHAPDRFYRYHRSLFSHQPKESSPGLTDGQLGDLAADAGVSNLHWIRNCIDKGRFYDWVQSATDRVVNGPIPNTDLRPSKLKRDPLVIVNGKHYAGSITDAAQFKAFVLQASGESYQAANTPTPTPTPTATTKPTSKN